MEKKDVLVLTLLFLLSFYLYTLPIRENQFPFGEGDAAHKYGLADWMYFVDRAPRDMPFFYGTWYPFINPDDFYGPPNVPPYFVDMVATRVVGGGDRFTAVNLFLALTAAGLASFTVYFVMRKLYNFWIASVSAFMLLFPLQSVMAYLWGQRPHLIALAFIPLIFYSYHRYTESYLRKKPKQVYLIISALLTAGGSVIYMHIIMFVAIFMVVYTAYLFIQEKKLPFDIKHAIISTLLVVIIVAPFLPDLTNQITMQRGEFKIQNLGHLFHWFKAEPEIQNQFLYPYTVHGGWWTFPFLIFGIVILLMRRNRRDMLLLSWLFSLYLMLHLDVINLIDQGRVGRLIYGSAHIFYPITAIGFFGVLSLVKVPKQQKTILRYILIVIVVVLSVVLMGKPSYQALKGAYPPIMRMTPYQYEAALWLSENLPEKSVIYAQGQVTYPKLRWIHMFSRRAITGYNREFSQNQEEVSVFPETNYVTHLLFDYSDFSLMGNQPEIDKLKGLEQELAQNATLLYDQNFIRVYQIAEP